MVCTITIREIDPEQFEAFMEAWRPEPWPAPLRETLVLRNDQDPGQIVTIGFVDIPAEELDDLEDYEELMAADADRLGRIAATVDARIVMKGAFRVAERLERPAGT